MLTLRLPYEKAFVCEICAHTSTDPLEIETHERGGKPETSEVVIGQCVKIDDTLWADDWHEPRLETHQDWIVERLSYASSSTLHQLTITLGSSAPESVKRKVPYAHFSQFWKRDTERAA